MKWVVVPFNNIFKPGPNDFDFDINQVSYCSKRDQAVDFSDSYYDVEQAVVAPKYSQFANAQSLADLKDAKLGAQIGTTSYDAILNTSSQSEQPNVYNRTTTRSTRSRTADRRLVVDFPTSLYVTAVQVPKSRSSDGSRARRGALRPGLRGRQPAARLRQRGPCRAARGRHDSRVPAGVDRRLGSARPRVAPLESVRRLRAAKHADRAR